MSTKTTKKAKSVKKTDKVKVQKIEAQKANEQNVEKKTISIISYAPKNPESPQFVPDFGHGKHDLHARTAYTLSCYLFKNKGWDRFNAKQAHDIARELLSDSGFPPIDYTELYSKNYCDSPYHRGLHAISKGETNEVKTDKTGKTIDTFARGMRELIRKSPLVGISKDDGYYTPNEKVDYKEVDLPELVGLLKQVALNDPRAKTKYNFE